MQVAEKAKKAMKGEAGDNGNGQKNQVPKTLVHFNSSQILNLLERYKPQISQALPGHLKAERVIQLATTVISTNPDLKQCTPQSLIGGIMQASLLGLSLIPQFGECFLIPYENKKMGFIEAQFMIGYKGYIKMMRNTGLVQSVDAQVVRAKDEFKYELGLHRDIIHRRNDSEDEGEMTHAYAIVWYKDGGYDFRVLNRRQVMARKACSKAANSKYSPWNNPDQEEKMWQKSAIRDLWTFVPMSDERYLIGALTDENVITPDMFSMNGTGVKLDRIEEAQVVEEKPEEKKSERKTKKARSKSASVGRKAKDEPKPEEKSETESKEQELKSSDEFLNKALDYKTLIDDRNLSLGIPPILKKHNVESLEKVPPEKEQEVLEALKKLATG